MKDTQVLSKVTNLYMGQTAFLRWGKLTHIRKYSSHPRFVMSSSLFLITNRVKAENVYQV